MNRQTAFRIIIAVLAILVVTAVLWASEDLVRVEHRESGTVVQGPAAPSRQPEEPAPRPEAPASPTIAASGLAIPVAGIRPEDLTDTYEDARSAGRQHNAIDIAAPRGTPVVAAADGRVVRLFLSEAGGKTIYMLAPDRRTVYYYAHLDGYADGLAEGQFIRQGEKIGYVGDTGNAVPGDHHLHFAIWTIDDPEQFWDGEPVNPYPLLK
jgi:peptidoglycan LD-endopeptidase LytH